MLLAAILDIVAFPAIANMHHRISSSRTNIARTAIVIIATNHPHRRHHHYRNRWSTIRITIAFAVAVTVTGAIVISNTIRIIIVFIAMTMTIITIINMPGILMKMVVMIMEMVCPQINHRMQIWSTPNQQSSSCLTHSENWQGATDNPTVRGM
jgi:hypothetical protein